MSTTEAKDRAARLLRKPRGSVSSQGTSQQKSTLQRHGSVSTISFMDDPNQDDIHRPTVKMENTYQLQPYKKFPSAQVKSMVRDVLEGYLSEERYEPELCRQMTKTLSEVVKARVKELLVKRYKIVVMIHIGQLHEQGMRIGSRCLWDSNFDTFASYEFRNNSLYAIGTVYAVYTE